MRNFFTNPKYRFWAAIAAIMVMVSMLGFTTFAESSVDISSKTATVIKNEVAAAFASGNVTIIGSRTLSGTLEIDIPSGKKAIWEADFTSSTGSNSTNWTGGGTLEITSGSSFTNTGSGRAVNIASDGICYWDGINSFHKMVHKAKKG